MLIENIFEYLTYFENLYFFKLILFILSFTYLLLPLPVTPLIIFNSIYFQELSFFYNLILINLSYIAVYKVIHLAKLDKFINDYLFKKFNKKKISNFNLNEFSKVFILRLLIPIPLLNYYLSLRNYSFRKSVVCTFISLIPYIFIITGTSKNLISENNFNFNYFAFYFLYVLVIILINKFFFEKNKD